MQHNKMCIEPLAAKSGGVFSGRHANKGKHYIFSLFRMVGGDVTVTWMDQRSGKGYAQDYYLDAKSQCAGSRGACPDRYSYAIYI